MYSDHLPSHSFMKMKISFLFTALIASVGLFAQSTYGIKKVHAYYEEHMPGNIPVGEDGQPVKKYPVVVHHIFIETGSKTKIQWKTAWKDGKSYSVSTIEVTASPVVLGKEKISEKEVVLKPSKGNKLWKLELNTQNKMTKSPLKAKAGEIILQGIYNGKKIYKRIEKEIELYTPLSV
jgi:hypothetical protein